MSSEQSQHRTHASIKDCISHPATQHRLSKGVLSVASSFYTSENQHPQAEGSPALRRVCTIFRSSSRCLGFSSGSSLNGIEQLDNNTFSLCSEQPSDRGSPASACDGLSGHIVVLHACHNSQ